MKIPFYFKIPVLTIFLSTLFLTLQGKEEPSIEKFPQATLINKTEKTNDLEVGIFRNYLEKPRFTKTGLADFFKFYFNTSLYAQFLPRTFIHLVDFFDYAINTNKPASFIVRVFLIFDQRMGECPWINAYALIVLLDEFSKKLPIFCQEPDAPNRLSRMEKELKKALNRYGNLLQKNRKEFIKNTASALETILSPEQTTLDVYEVQQCATRFIGHAIQKIIWNPRDQIEVWDNVCAIASRLYDLYENGVIKNQDDLNLLLWSLIYRFGYFIECAGSQLSQDFFKRIEADLSHKKPAPFFIDEQEEFLNTKRQYLVTLATQGMVKSAAAQQGIFFEGIV